MGGRELRWPGHPCAEPSPHEAFAMLNPYSVGLKKGGKKKKGLRGTTDRRFSSIVDKRWHQNSRFPTLPHAWDRPSRLVFIAGVWGEHAVEGEKPVEGLGKNSCREVELGVRRN